MAVFSFEISLQTAEAYCQYRTHSIDTNNLVTNARNLAFSKGALSSYHPIVPRAVRRTSSPTAP